MRRFLVAALVGVPSLFGCAHVQTASLENQMADFRAREQAEVDEKLSEIGRGKIPPDYRKLVDAWFVDNLKDPDSRKISFTTNPFGSLVCGTVNAKNALGGYTGKDPFYGYFVGPSVSVVTLPADDIHYLKGQDSIPSIEGALLEKCGFL